MKQKLKFIDLIILVAIFFGIPAWAHVPAVLLPIKGTPISSYFLGQSDISRAVYSELTQADDIFVVHLNVRGGENSLVQLLTPVCENLPRYEQFQPSFLILKGDLPWKNQGESQKAYLARLKEGALAEVTPNFTTGKRPKFFEEFQKQYYWVGGEWRGALSDGLHAIVVYDTRGDRGVFSLGINEKESWTPDLFKYVEEVLPVLSKGLCNPKGFSGNIRL